MKILLVHNHYQKPGGEDQVFAAEGALLESYGHTVVRYEAHNDQVGEFTSFQLAKATIWNSHACRELKNLIKIERPEIMHVHNTFPLISPVAYYAAKSENIPVVQTLHNYRLLCLNPNLFRNGKVCEDCLGKFMPWPGILHSCYRGNRKASGVVAMMLISHRILRTWLRDVDMFIALSVFSRKKFIEEGLPNNKITVKPNFVGNDPGIGSGEGNYAIFVGRLSSEKGIETLLEAWKSLNGRVRLKIAGDGPLASKVVDATQKMSSIDYVGHLSRDEIFLHLKNASVMIFPSLCYEGFPLTIAEAYATGLPVIGSQTGSISELIQPGKTGLCFEPGNSRDLVRQVDWIVDHPRELASMRLNARREFEEKYTDSHNYDLLLKIYRQVLGKQIYSGSAT
ncbi:MAG TPA: glycosyltransferase family 4 protein [Nitrospirales bacterium]|nr:glycosyl transferase family 1 [Nitrospiraceae bacterium]HNP27952.1 glycosyltransferase family 4 protein [Nitrospirales bacterium]